MDEDRRDREGPCHQGKPFATFSNQAKQCREVSGFHLPASARTFQEEELSSPLLLVVAVLKQFLMLVPIYPGNCILNPLHKVISALRLCAFGHCVSHTLFE